MTIDLDITVALFRHLDVLEDVPKIAWEGVDYEPSGPYLEATVLRNITQNLFIGDAAPARHTGLFQVAVVVAEGTGVVTSLTLAGRIADHFAKGTKLLTDGAEVHIYEPPSVRPSVPEPGYLRTPVVIPYQAFRRT